MGDGKLVDTNAYLQGFWKKVSTKYGQMDRDR